MQVSAALREAPSTKGTRKPTFVNSNHGGVVCRLQERVQNSVLAFKKLETLFALRRQRPDLEDAQL